MPKLKLKDSTVTRIMIAEKGKSLRCFAQMIRISHPYLSQVLNGKRNPSPTVAYKIASGVGLNIEDVFEIKIKKKQVR